MWLHDNMPCSQVLAASSLSTEMIRPDMLSFVVSPSPWQPRLEAETLKALPIWMFSAEQCADVHNFAQGATHSVHWIHCSILMKILNLFDFFSHFLWPTLELRLQPQAQKETLQLQKLQRTAMPRLRFIQFNPFSSLLLTLCRPCELVQILHSVWIHSGPMRGRIARRYKLPQVQLQGNGMDALNHTNESQLQNSNSFVQWHWIYN